MAEPLFPESLPGPEIGSISYKPAVENVLKSQIPGVIKRRRRFTRAPLVMSCQLYLTAAQLDALLDFYTDTLRETGEFLWHDWRQPTRPANALRYAFQAYPDHEHWGDAADAFRATLSLYLLGDAT